MRTVGVGNRSGYSINLSLHLEDLLLLCRSFQCLSLDNFSDVPIF